MSITHSPKISTNGLVMHYDFNNPKSFIGAPTTNYTYPWNPRIDTSYALRNYDPGGTFFKRHPDGIRVWGNSGAELTAYENGGVTDWTNTCHAIWTYDHVLKKPVITMRNSDNIWQAFSHNYGINFVTQGLGVGSKYTISWLQWTDNLSRCAVVGLYTKTVGGSWNFWDGLASTGTTLNTKLRTWQRVYYTYTITSSWDLTYANQNIYMYGNNLGTGVLKVADVQFELLPYPTKFSTTLTRTATQGLLDLTKNTTSDITNLSYDATGVPYFNGTNNYITIPSVPANNIGTGSFTIIVWCKLDFSVDGWQLVIAKRAGGTGGGYYFGIYTLGGVPGGNFMLTNDAIAGTDTSSIRLLPATSNQWTMWTCILNRDTNTQTLIKNNYEDSVTINPSGGNYTGTHALYIGRDTGAGAYPCNGKIPSVKMYNRALSQAEIAQTFQADRGRYL
jgi:hypothetical protein